VSLDWVLLGNGRVALNFLERVADPPRALVLNGWGKHRQGLSLLNAAHARGVTTHIWPDLPNLTPETWLLSVYFGHILSPTLLAAVNGHAVNCHPSLLPWNRGADPAYWTLKDWTPAGVTLHAMVPAVDAGPILAQWTIPTLPGESEQQLYWRSEDAALGLLLEAWPAAVLKVWPGTPQPPGGSSHRKADRAPGHP
jgi:methionyl-tRNA formyltransferase